MKCWPRPWRAKVVPFDGDRYHVRLKVTGVPKGPPCVEEGAQVRWRSEHRRSLATPVLWQTDVRSDALPPATYLTASGDERIRIGGRARDEREQGGHPRQIRDQLLFELVGVEVSQRGCHRRIGVASSCPSIELDWVSERELEPERQSGRLMWSEEDVYQPNDRRRFVEVDVGLDTRPNHRFVRRRRSGYVSLRRPTSGHRSDQRPKAEKHGTSEAVDEVRGMAPSVLVAGTELARSANGRGTTGRTGIGIGMLQRRANAPQRSSSRDGFARPYPLPCLREAVGITHQRC